MTSNKISHTSIMKMLDECDRVQYLRTLPPADKYKVPSIDTLIWEAYASSIHL